MDGVLYSDFLAALIRRMAALLEARTEPFTDGVEVTNRKTSSSRRAVVLSVPPGGSTSNLLRTSFVTVDTVCRDEGDAVDLMNLTLALATSRGAGAVVNGQPFTYAEVNGGPNPDFAADGWFRQTAELEVRHRGRNLV